MPTPTHSILTADGTAILRKVIALTGEPFAPTGFQAVPYSPSPDTLPQAQEAAPVPQEVTRRQLFLAVHGPLGLTRAQLRASLGDDEGALIEFDEAQTFQRTHPLVSGLAIQLNLSTAQVDDIFRTAATL